MKRNVNKRQRKCNQMVVGLDRSQVKSQKAAARRFDCMATLGFRKYRQNDEWLTIHLYWLWWPADRRFTSLSSTLRYYGKGSITLKN